MKKTVLVLSAAVALSVMTVPAALAQENTPTCDAAKADVTKLQKKRDDAAAEERVREKADVKAAKDARDAAKAALDAFEPDPNASPEDNAAAKKLLEDALKARKADLEKAEKKQGEDSDKVVSLRAQVEAAIDERDDACGTTTTTPAPTPTPVPENDVDCDEVSASEAQRILDEDRNDPNNLDQDKDGIACEVDEILPDPADDNPVTINNNVAVPSGGVATGGGPAWAFQ